MQRVHALDILHVFVAVVLARSGGDVCVKPRNVLLYCRV